MSDNAPTPELVALLACPFCGSASPKLIEFPNSMESLYRILCSDVRCMAMIEGHTKRRAELVWNRRAPTLPGAGGGEWLPIESAPKDGTNVLLLIKWSETPLIGHFSHNRWWGDTEHYETSCSSYCYGGSPSTATGTEPTHWQPLPAATTPQQGG